MPDRPSGIGRREFIKRGAIVAGAAAWTAPAIQSMTRAAFGQVGTPACDCIFCGTVGFGNTVFLCEPATADDCNCLCCCDGITASCAECSHPGDPCNGLNINCRPLAAGEVCPGS